jgi:hypothetical protein
MRDDNAKEELFEGPGEGVELALPGDLIRIRHIATRASNRRQIVVLTADEAEFRGYSIGIDQHSLQILELPSGEVSTIALEYIVSISDGKSFSELTPPEKNVVDRRTASFRKTASDWLVKNWPKVYERRDSEDGHHQPSRQSPGRPPFRSRYGQTDPEGRLSSYANSEVRHGASEDGNQARGQ